MKYDFKLVFSQLDYMKANAAVKIYTIQIRDLFVLLQNHAFVKKTEEEYEKVVNFGDWVCKVMNIKPPS